MPSFSTKSEDTLATCDHRLQQICDRVIKTYDFSVLEGYRSDERQEELYRQGKSKLRAGESKHNQDPSLAVDIAPYPIDWEDHKRFYLLAGMMFQAAYDIGYPIRWGGDWDRDWEHNDQSFHDLPHFEIVE
jgi:peptidoglycan L-alanyl-D-glutamate endopeptidase CwlK